MVVAGGGCVVHRLVDDFGGRGGRAALPVADGIVEPRGAEEIAARREQYGLVGQERRRAA